jgi:hypothetical protein
MTTQHDAAWIVAAHTALRNNYGVHSGLAIAVAESLLKREKTAQANPDYIMRSPEAAVMAHMESEEEPVVDPDGEYPEPEASF